jgi:hypothetical protein
MLRILLAPALLLAAASAIASPCAAPGDYVRAGVTEARQPLVRPFVVQGLAVTALRQLAEQPWLELAVDSEATARRALAGAEVQTVNGAVLLSCRAVAAQDGRRVAAASAPLW